MVPQGAENKAVSEVVQAMAAEAGFDMKIRVTEFATSLNAAEAGEYQAYLIGWSGRTDPDQNVINHLGCNGPFNWGKYCSEAMQAALTEARTHSDPEKRKTAYARAVAVAEVDRPLIYIFHQALLFAHSDKITGYTQPPDGLIALAKVG